MKNVFKNMGSQVVISTREYKELVIAEEKRETEKVEEKNADLIFKNRLLKNLLLECNLKDGYLDCPIEELTDISAWNYGLKNPTKLIQVFSIEEMNLYIKQKKEEYDRTHKTEKE